MWAGSWARPPNMSWATRGPKPLIVRDIWLLVLPELRRNATVRKVLDWIIGVTRRDASTLLGAPTRGGHSEEFSE